MKTRLAWIESVAKFKDANEKQEKNVLRVVSGDPADPPSLETSLTYYRNELARALVDRGRVWRHCTPAGNADGTVTMNMNLAPAPAPAPVDPAAPAPAAPAAPAVAASHKLAANDIVFAFKEFPTQDGMSIPAYYVGEFQVTAVTDTTVTLKMTPTYRRGALQANEVDAPWMLYEVLPPDNHEAFADPADLKKALPDLPKALPAAELTKIGIPPAALSSYERDNGPGNVNDNKDNLWVKVKFLKAHEIVVDASTLVSPVDDVPFNGQGQAQTPRLLRSSNLNLADPTKFTPEAVKFAVNDIAIFDSKTADELANAQIVTKQELIYRRKLNDYEKAFQVISRKIYMLRSKAEVAVRDTATVVAAYEKANDQIKLLDAQKLLLQADYDKVVYERDEMRKYADAVAARVKAKRAEMSRLYLENKALYEQIKDKTQKLTEQVERNQRLAAEEKK
jgi:hypothetical protein